MADNSGIAAGATAGVAVGGKVGGWLSDLTFSVDGQGGGGQGFQLSRDEAEGQLRKFKTIRDRLDSLQSKTERLERIPSPAEDPATVRMNQALVGGGQGQGAFVAGARSVVQQYNYVNEIVMRLEKALGIYQESDEQASGSMRKTGQSGGNEGIGE